MEEWIALYKFGRLAGLAFVLVAIGAYAYWPSHKERLEAPALRMLEEEEEG
ncbi:MAG: cbb3-type cytochrome c oxidase subunit 3 [Myxococcota bacterium]|nr:cbb3-type cytochrome c oxidase subunit 3 [Myxococcota bacterium]